MDAGSVGPVFGHIGFRIFKNGIDRDDGGPRQDDVVRVPADRDGYAVMQFGKYPFFHDGMNDFLRQVRQHI